MKANEIVYRWYGLNSGNVEVSTGSGEASDWSVTINVDYTNEKASLDYVSKKELIELGEMLIWIGKLK
jgi:uncharacterized membrane protein